MGGASITELFRTVHDPVVTGHSGLHAGRELMMLPGGEIRHYGAHFYRDRSGKNAALPVVRRSFDYGISWLLEPVTGKTPGASIRSPYSGDYLTLRRRAKQPDNWHEFWPYDLFPLPGDVPEGVYVFRSNHPDDRWEMEQIFSDPIHIQRQPLPLRKRQRWLLGAEQWIDKTLYPVVLISDDDGRSWRKTILPPPPVHTVAWPHKGLRWLQCGCEPVIAEYPDGRLHMLLRTSTDRHWQCFSEDGGESWSSLEPSPFYAVATMPNLTTLADGRLLAVWNNTSPLPELDHALQTDLDEDARNGVWEDVFTNRDVLHAAISDDMGKTWIGFRELLLNPIRNYNDFRTIGGSWVLRDKSIHQTQVLELPENKVLVALGQHPCCEALLLFDLDYLYERERREDFKSGLVNWSIHQYVRSHSGGFCYAGHCAWNRRPGASLIPAPDGSPREMLQIARHPDSRLLYEKEGAVWNFPAVRCGVLKLRLILMPGSAGMRITLTDRWFNPVDPVVHKLSPFVLELDSAGRIEGVPMLTPGKECEIEISFDQNAGSLRFRCGELAGESPLRQPVDGAMSYLHLQSLSEGSDPFGVLIAAVEMRGERLGEE